MISEDKVFLEWLSAVRRDFHMHPELKYQEKRTTERIKEILNELSIENYGFEDITGAVGIIKGGKPGKTIALRADIDALPINEMNDVPYKSKNKGIMHACGHDANTTIMLGVAKFLVDSGLSKELNGNVKFFFQPAEEGGAGAAKMIERGVLENPGVDRILAGHLGPNLPVGTIGIYKDRGYASADGFHLVITGKGGHGARPQATCDPILAGAHFIVALNTIISRNIDPLDVGVISVGRFEAGRAINVIPEQAEIDATIRALTEPVRKRLMERILELAQGMEKTFGAKFDLEFTEGYPILDMDKEVNEFIFSIGQDVLGDENVKPIPPTTGSEDFAFFSQKKPSAMICIGCTNESKGITNPLHSAYFDMDEDVLGVGVKIFSEAVIRYLKD